MAAAISVQTIPNAAWGAIGVALNSADSMAQIAFDNAAAGGVSTSVSTYTKAYTCGVAANYLLIGVMGDISTDKVTGVTYNAIAMTQLSKLFAGTLVGWMYVYGLANPTTGSSQNIVVSASGSCSILGCEITSYGSVSAAQPNMIATTSAISQGVIWTVLTPSMAGCWGWQFSRNTNGTVANQISNGTGTTAVLRVSQATDGVNGGSIVDTNGIIPDTPTIVLTPNTSQWQLHRFDLKPSGQEHA